MTRRSGSRRRGQQRRIARRKGRGGRHDQDLADVQAAPPRLQIVPDSGRQTVSAVALCRVMLGFPRPGHANVAFLPRIWECPPDSAASGQRCVSGPIIRASFRSGMSRPRSSRYRAIDQASASHRVPCVSPRAERLHRPGRPRTASAPLRLTTECKRVDPVLHA